jgi:hypothetical protein
MAGATELVDALALGEVEPHDAPGPMAHPVDHEVVQNMANRFVGKLLACLARQQQGIGHLRQLVDVDLWEILVAGDQQHLGYDSVVVHGVAGFPRLVFRAKGLEQAGLECSMITNSLPVTNSSHDTSGFCAHRNGPADVP